MTITVRKTSASEYTWKAVVEYGGARQYFYGNTPQEAIAKVLVSMLEKKP